MENYMAVTNALTARQVHTLQGLYYGPANISATERGDFELMNLVRLGYARADMSLGLMAWRIEPKGRDYLRDTGQTPNINDEIG
jgi:hypothetical protein